ncbi:Oidioi.mRNA.OKI2018_I69.chr1.g2749.t1.cds [Oikopleura dioica]|uniref:Oidioi.mRNA.OKI2018_I69.chr1.g2749.t1.cds n=1 Tax=Oikopleura dioica TaxID=34765 RepID=A0ABN7SXG4_OIKDI|nr:Oidioi.mRNA.OKI2018_I69.chr1.g2749.t1.cds [Oikopleura dioica]
MASYYALIPDADNYLNFQKASEYCKLRNKTLSTISSFEEQEKISKLAFNLSQINREGARLWLGLVRKENKEKFEWKYHVIDENDQKVDVTCDVTKPTFWERAPDPNTMDTDCAILDVDYDWTGDFDNHDLKNWEPVNCFNSLNGDSGHAHGFLCTDNVPVSSI